MSSDFNVGTTQKADPFASLFEPAPSAPSARPARSQRVESALSGLGMDSLTSWMEMPAASSTRATSKEISTAVSSKAQDIPNSIVIKIAAYVGAPHITSKLNRQWRDATRESYKQILASASIQRNGVFASRHSLILLTLATKKVNPKATRVLTPEEYLKGDSTICCNIFKAITIIQDENLIQFFNCLKLPAGVKPSNLPVETRQKAFAIRRWMAMNETILKTIEEIDLSAAGITSVPPELSHLLSNKKFYLFLPKDIYVSSMPESVLKFSANLNFR